MVQSDETLGWKLSSVDETLSSTELLTHSAAKSDQEEIATLLTAMSGQKDKGTWLSKVTAIVSRMISGLRLPTCAKESLAEQLGSSILS